MLVTNHGIPLITSSYDEINNDRNKKYDDHNKSTIIAMVGFRNVMKKCK